MKKHLVVLITIALIVNVCTWTGCGNDASTASPEQSTKPSLIIVEEESGDYRQAAKARINASEDTGDDMISPIMAETSADGPAKVSEPDQNTANPPRHFRIILSARSQSKISTAKYMQAKSRI